MRQSLTILLPVKNAQSTLTSTVQQILDEVSELSEQIELLIIDDGSADATSEVATELTQNFPQVRAICQNRPLGREAAIRKGLQESNGEVVLIQEQEGGKPLDEIVRTWKTSLSSSRLFFRMDTAEDRARKKSAKITRKESDAEMLDRLAERQRQILSRPVRPNFLEKSRDNAFDI